MLEGQPSFLEVEEISSMEGEGEEDEFIFLDDRPPFLVVTMGEGRREGGGGGGYDGGSDF